MGAVLGRARGSERDPKAEAIAAAPIRISSAPVDDGQHETPAPPPSCCPEPCTDRPASLHLDTVSSMSPPHSDPDVRSPTSFMVEMDGREGTRLFAGHCLTAAAACVLRNALQNTATISRLPLRQQVPT